MRILEPVTSNNMTNAGANAPALQFAEKPKKVIMMTAAEAALICIINLARRKHEPK